MNTPTTAELQLRDPVLQATVAQLEESWEENDRLRIRVEKLENSNLTVIAENAALRAALEAHENAARENLISARIIEAENRQYRNCYGISRDCRFILERTEKALAQARDALGKEAK